MGCVRSIIWPLIRIGAFLTMGRLRAPAYILLIVALAVACGDSSTPTSDAAAIPQQSVQSNIEEPVTYVYDNLPYDDDEGSALAEFRAISKWDRLELTYHFLNGSDKLPGTDEHEAVRRAFQIWQDASPLSFTETQDQAGANILVSWHVRDHGDGVPFDGPGNVLAHAEAPNLFVDRRITLHFDDEERWVVSAQQNVDLVTVAAHEIGHNLGLDHSRDPNALMFASYSGPYQFLGLDDIAGIQDVYGAAKTQAAPSPRVPPPQATPPASARRDSDGDGLSDLAESFLLGTDPNNPDSDGDGISDGTEVAFQMNPLDPDMDKDGISDGDEIRAGTNPFFPEMPVEEVSIELAKEISAFLVDAIRAQERAFRTGDSSIAAQVLGGEVLKATVEAIAALESRGLVQVSEFDAYQSAIRDIRIVTVVRIEVDTCEVWSTTLFDRGTGLPVSDTERSLQPQTLTIERFREGWFITQAQFIPPPAFCRY